MFRLPFESLVNFYLLATLIFLGVLWIVGHQRRRKDLHRYIQFRLRCTRCAKEFEDRSSNSLVTCPHCGTKNERTKWEIF